jgi:hypothetical protein
MSRALRLPVYWRALGTPDGFARDLQRFPALTPIDIRRVANEVLDPRARLVAFVRRNDLADAGGTLSGRGVP